MNFVIVHFNTPELTTCLIRSIFKLHKDRKIIVFDNSDKKPLPECVCDSYYDNTKGQIIDFKTELDKYTNKIKESEIINNFGSAKHSITIQWLLNNINEPFVLLDSDVLLKKPVDFINPNFGCISDTITYKYNVKWHNYNKIKTRIAPFITYFNPKILSENSINFFDTNRMDGLSIEGHDNDTGTSFYEDLFATNSSLFKKIKYTDYIIHYGKGSYSDYKNAISWCVKYKNLWLN
jgi:hypothetical protein